MNLTLSIDKQVAERARKVARAMGKSLNQVVRDYLLELAEPGEIEREIAELHELSERARGHGRGQRLDRDALHERA